MPRKKTGLQVRDVIGERLRQLRMKHGWQQQELAEELDGIGWPMDRTAVAKIETGARNVSVEDLLALAAALGVEPSALLLPRDDYADISVTPVLNAPAWRVRAWMHGYQPVTNWDDEIETRFFNEEISDQEWLARRERVVGQLRWSAFQVEQAAAQPDAQEMRDALELIVGYAQRALDELGD